MIRSLEVVKLVLGTFTPIEVDVKTKLLRKVGCIYDYRSHCVTTAFSRNLYYNNKRNPIQ